MPAFVKVNLVSGNRLLKKLQTNGRNPFISVIEPPIKATWPTFAFSNCNSELVKLPRRWMLDVFALGPGVFLSFSESDGDDKLPPSVCFKTKSTIGAGFSR